MTAQAHRPVMAKEVAEALNIRADGVYVDATYGRGGHAREILERMGPQGRLIAMDRDPDAVAAAQRDWGGDARFRIVKGSFSMVGDHISELGLEGRINGIVLDLGVSSPQLDDAGRGFSFSANGPLDMRMDPSSGPPASEWLDTAAEEEIRDVIRTLGEERFAARIARAIVAQRREAPLRTTGELASLIAAAVPTREPGKHPATRSFQAIRMHINRELEELRSVLPQALRVLAPAGRIAVISFHSLEDRIVKRFMREAARGDEFPPDLPVTAAALRPMLRLVGKARHASGDEVAANPRARSAVLRVAERTEVPCA
jgi:16S rRNA (cytosine1402-N4)-methyltransferase